jgi:hypothetical protein
MIIFLLNIYLSYDLFIDITYDYYLTICYTCKLNFICQITTYYKHNQVL